MNKFCKPIFAMAFAIGIFFMGTPQPSYAATKVRWEKNPILVCLPPVPQSQLMKKAFKEWQAATKEKVTFNFLTANSCPNAQITVGYSPNKTVSRTRLSYSDKYILNAHIEMGLLTYDGKKATDKLLEKIMEHEIAHAIGIKEHTNTPQSILQPQVREDYKITNDILIKVNQLYK